MERMDLVKRLMRERVVEYERRTDSTVEFYVYDGGRSDSFGELVVDELQENYEIYNNGDEEGWIAELGANYIVDEYIIWDERGRDEDEWRNLGVEMDKMIKKEKIIKWLRDNATADVEESKWNYEIVVDYDDGQEERFTIGTGAELVERGVELGFEKSWTIGDAEEVAFEIVVDEFIKGKESNGLAGTKRELGNKFDKLLATKQSK